MSPDGHEFFASNLTVGSVSFSPDSVHVLSGNEHRICVWHTASGKRVRTIEADGTAASYSSDGLFILSANRTWNAETGEEHQLLDSDGGVPCLGPEGSRVAYRLGDIAELRLLKTGASLFELRGHRDEINCLSFSPDGTRVATGSNDHTIKVWDARIGNASLQLEGGGRDFCLTQGGHVSYPKGPYGTR